MKLVVVHYHLRPGGVRRVIELATPALAGARPGSVRGVVLATGEPPDPGWVRGLSARLAGVPVDVEVHAGFGYATGPAGPDWRRTSGEAVARLRSVASGDAVVWAHNLGLGRNLPLAGSLAAAAADGAFPLVSLHHDWWFENRWQHLNLGSGGAPRNLTEVAGAVLAPGPGIAHLAINRTDAAVLAQHLPGRGGWLPNPVDAGAPPSAGRVAAARRWLTRRIGEDAPVWLLPCRLLRRKNIAEALLLTRWLRPEAWLVTTAGPSSSDEQAYARALAAAAGHHRWRLLLGALADAGADAPSVPELMQASEAVLLTSLQEGFGLPFVEAAAAGRPLLARELPNIAPDLAAFGFTFPQSYPDILVDPGLLDWTAECARQLRVLRRWKSRMPVSAARRVGVPAGPLRKDRPEPVPFSRLTLAAQLEVLAHPAGESWRACEPLNPFLASWRHQAGAGRLEASPWPATATRELGGAAYARRFFDQLAMTRTAACRGNASLSAQGAFLELKLAAPNLYPLLWEPGD